MSTPLIGITTRNTEHITHGWPMIASPRTYSEAIIRAGAIPVLIPTNMPSLILPNLLSKLDGVIFTGGGDIETSRFNGQPHERVYGVDKERDNIEFELVRRVIDLDMPFLGICRGFQVINVALGGRLYTHILDQLDNALDHSYNPELPTNYPAHPINLKPDSLLAGIFGKETVTVNSLHHQGAEQIASELETIGWAPDGLAEAFVFPEHPFGLAVQWHPEWMSDDPYMPKLFTAFQQAASDYHSGRTK